MAMEEYIDSGFYTVSGIDLQLSSLLCPISMEPMTEPVLCEDGHTYNKSSIELWMKMEGNYLNKVNDKVKSPLNGKLMGKTLRPNDFVRKLLEEYAEQIHNLKALDVVEAKDKGKGDVSVPRQLPKSVVSIHALSKAFLKLDPLRDILMQTLDGWEPPEIVVIGPEKSGKSSVLERLAMVPIFPRDTELCTRMAIRVRLRRCSPKEATAVLKVIDVETGVTVMEPRRIPIENGFEYVREAMSDVLSRIDDVVSIQEAIVLDVHHPTVPNLDLIDMPGLKTTPREHKAATYAVLENHILKRGENSLYLAVCAAGPRMRPNTNVGLQFITEHQLQDKTIGVFTFCDDLYKKPHFETLAQHLQGTTAIDGAVQLEKYGWVATMNDNNVERAETNYQRLQIQAQNEEEFFNGPAISAALEAADVSDRVNSSALVHKLHIMYTEFLADTWAPKTFTRIRKEYKEEKYKDALLGSPQAEILCRSGRNIGDAVREHAGRLLNTHLPGLFKEYISNVVKPHTTSITREVQRRIQILKGNVDTNWESSESCVEDDCIIEHADLKHMGERTETCVRCIDWYMIDQLEGARQETQAFWRKSIRAVLHAKTIVKIHNPEDPDSQVDILRQYPCPAAYPSFCQTLRTFTGGKTAAIEEILERPPFQLCRFPNSVEAIVDCIMYSFDRMWEAATPKLQKLTELFFSPESPWMTWTHNMDTGALRIHGSFNLSAFSGAVLYTLLRALPSCSSLIDDALQVSGFQGEIENCVEERSVITNKRILLIQAFRGMCEALGDLAPEGWEEEVAAWEAEIPELDAKGTNVRKQQNTSKR
mmetsp:Transcript_12090/g.14395  ORF Transcript_12090/g.14395 Transcript_12090/m.14395 type:complete len:818 (-) Transcript_12090:74-2527(-)